MSLEYVNDEDTKELLAAVEQYARRRGLDRLGLTFTWAGATTWEEPNSKSASEATGRRFRLEASHWFEEQP